MRRVLAFLVLVPVVVAPLLAADNDPPPFPEKGSFLPGPYHALNITGPHKGTIIAWSVAMGSIRLPRSL